MNNPTRRTLLKHGILASAAAVGTWPRDAAAQAPSAANAALAADLVVLDATIHTVDERQPRAAALAVRDGKFVAVGGNDAIRQLVGDGTQVIEAAGKTVVPGFIDAHTHPADSGVYELLLVDCNLLAISEIKAALRKRAASTPAGEWVFGFKYDDTKLQDQRPLTRADLDEIAPDHPVRVTHRGGHTAVVNSAAYKRVGVSRETPDPEGGKFGRDAAGELTGFCAERALELFDKAGGTPRIGPQHRQAGVKLISELMTAAGLTTVHNVLASKEDFIAYQDAMQAGQLKFRVYILADAELFASLRSAGIRPRMGSEWLRIGGLKLICDGSASERTMRMSQPYVGRPNDYGILVTPQDKLNDAVLEAHAAGFQVGVHANGDVAIDMVLKAYELAQRLHPRDDARHRIEHCTLVNPDLLQRIAAIGAIPTPFYTYVYYHGDKWSQYGDERLNWMFAHRSFLDHGIRVAGASDYVPGPFEPLMAIQSMVTRTDYRGRVWGARQRITVPEALRICTINGAYASFEESLKGSITPGKLADFVILAADPHATPPNEIKDIPIQRTIVGGKTVYPSPPT